MIVGLNSDSSVRQLKGKGRPLHNERIRARGLIDFADSIIIFNESSPINYLRELRPDIYVKGGDYDLESINQDERKLVKSYGGKIVIIPIVHNVSTTKIIDKIKNGRI